MRNSIGRLKQLPAQTAECNTAYPEVRGPLHVGREGIEPAHPREDGCELLANIAEIESPLLASCVGLRKWRS